MRDYTDLTEMEKQVLADMPKDNFFEDGLESVLWCDCFLDFTCSLQAEQARGVLSSLIKKDYIYPIGSTREDNTIQFTEKGQGYLEEVLGIND